eukprot:COSAG02_NODE_44753_length_363_cov_0.837121_1_plen_90_part_10
MRAFLRLVVAGLVGIAAAEETSGCTDTAAANYDPYATVDDSSCTYCSEYYNAAECGAAEGCVWLQEDSYCDTDTWAGGDGDTGTGGDVSG